MTDLAAPLAPMRAAMIWAVAGAAILILAVLTGVAIGEMPLPPAMVGAVLANNLWGAGYPVEPIDAGIIWAYRLPRALVAAACGAGLALSGVVLQSLVRNALADPYLLGVSAGASTGAVAVAMVRSVCIAWRVSIARRSHSGSSRSDPTSARLHPRRRSARMRYRRVTFCWSYSR